MRAFVNRAGAAALLVCAGATALAQQVPDYRPIQIVIPVSGMTLPDTRDQVARALRRLEGVGGCSLEPDRVTLVVGERKTLRLSEVARVFATHSTTQAPLTVALDAVALSGRCVLHLAGVAEAEPAAVAQALRGASAVERVEPTKGGDYLVVFQGPSGATLGAVTAALRRGLEDARGADEPAVVDVSWTGPRRPPALRPPRQVPPPPPPPPGRG